MLPDRPVAETEEAVAGGASSARTPDGQRALWDAARRGDAVAREALFDAIADLARTSLLQRRVPAGELDDLTSAVVVSVLAYFEDGGEAPRNLGGFLYYRAWDVFSRYTREKGRWAAYCDTVTRVAVPREEPDALDTVAAGGLRHAMDECRARLDRELGKLLDLVYDQRKRQSEVARLLSRSETWVCRGLQRALERMQWCLKRKGFEP